MEEEEEPETGIAFTVVITKPDETRLIVDAVAADEFTISNLRFVPAGVESDNNALYGGPEFNTLEETVQNSFLDYLGERGIDGDLAYFILNYSREKEQKEYLYWLKQLGKFSA